MNDAEFRAAAEECRRLAARTTDPVEKQELQRIADEWLWLAQLAGVTRGGLAGGPTTALDMKVRLALAYFPDRNTRQRQL
jgi:hypothetical protein